MVKHDAIFQLEEGKTIKWCQKVYAHFEQVSDIYFWLCKHTKIVWAGDNEVKFAEWHAGGI